MKKVQCTVALGLSFLAIQLAQSYAEEGCMTWLHEYEGFHRKIRGSPSATYLVHEVEGGSGGLGDRLRGMLFTVRLAASLNRVVLFKWNHPAPLSNFFVPGSSIDWTLDGISYKRQSVFQYMDVFDSDRLARNVAAKADKFVTVITNMKMNATCPGCPALPSLFSHDAVCLWNRILRPTPAILRKADEQLAELGLVGHRYAAVHLRMGGLIGEGEVNRGSDPLSLFLEGTDCARNISMSMNFPEPKTLIVSDNHNLRRLVRRSTFPSLYIPSHLPVHLDRGKNMPLEEHQQTIVELELLARSECIVLMRSGFSHHAWLRGGGKLCAAQLPACKRSVAHFLP